MVLEGEVLDQYRIRDSKCFVGLERGFATRPWGIDCDCDQDSFLFFFFFSSSLSLRHGPFPSGVLPVHQRVHHPGRPGLPGVHQRQRELRPSLPVQPGGRVQRRRLRRRGHLQRRDLGGRVPDPVQGAARLRVVHLGGGGRALPALRRVRPERPQPVRRRGGLPLRGGQLPGVRPGGRLRPGAAGGREGRQRVRHRGGAGGRAIRHLREAGQLPPGIRGGGGGRGSSCAIYGTLY